MKHLVYRLATSCRAQMTVEIAVVIPPVLVIGMIVFNLMSFIEACSVFDQAALDAIVSQGVAPSGEQTQIGSVEQVRAALQESIGRENNCEIDVQIEPVESEDYQTSFAISPLLSRYVCTLSYHPWPRSIRLPVVSFEAPLALHHVRELVVDRYRSGVVI